MTPLKSMTLGSLFDGIGGFPLSAAMCGIKPCWASEIEPFPILVTHKRFPNMKHLGSVTEINGTKPKSLNQVIKWLADPQSDSAEYKAYGNSLAIPCSYDVLRRISENA